MTHLSIASFMNVSNLFPNALFRTLIISIIIHICRHVYIWTVANGRLLTTLQAPVGIITDLLIPTARGQVVTHLGATNLVHVWSLGDAIGHVGMLDRLTRPISRMLFTSDNKVFNMRRHCKRIDCMNNKGALLMIKALVAYWR